jgi:pimeloyl-ACP methyl ester carboxylesterase
MLALTACALPFATPTIGQVPLVCGDRRVPVSLAPGHAPDHAPDQFIHGRLCHRANIPAEAVQLLVPGLTYNSGYWDVPGHAGRYSYVRRAAAAGYATFAVDALGTGLSSHPQSAQVTVTSSAYTLHQVITALRSRFRRVVLVGHSQGSITGLVEAARYRDVDAVVASGTLHAVNADTQAAYGNAYIPASRDPRFAPLNLDPGYVVTVPGVRKKVFFNPADTESSILRFDERNKDVGSLAAAKEAAAFISGDPATSITRSITVPVLSVIGQKDIIHCGGTGGADCSSAQTVEGPESRFYGTAAGLTVRVIPRTGHSLALERTAPESGATILDWVRAHVRP